MSLSSTVNRVDATGNGTTATYNFTFRIFQSSDLKVIVKDADNVVTTLTETTHYTVSGGTGDSGGSISLVAGAFSWLDGSNFLETGASITIRRVRPLTQLADIRNQGSFFAETHEDEFDKLVMISQQQQDEIDRSVALPDEIAASAFDPTLPTGIEVANTAIVTNATGDGLALGPTVDEISNAQTYATNASTSATAAAASASAAATSASNAAASEAAAQAAAASNVWNDVVFITNADSPYTITSSHRGQLIAADTSSGSITINLPGISGLDLTTPYVVGFKKTSSDGNAITINRDGTDTIDGATSKTLTVSDSGATFIPDTDPTPDEWTTAEFGAQAGNLTSDLFSGDGSTTGFTLSVDPGSENNTFVFISGVYQQKDVYSVSGTTLTFSSAPPTGTNNINVISGTTLSIGTPSDATVTTAKIADANVTRAKLADGALANRAIASKTAAYTATSSDDVITCSSSGGAFAVTLPTAVGIDGKIYDILKTDVSTNSVTINTTSSQTVGTRSSGSIGLNRLGDRIKVISDGSNWQILEKTETEILTDEADGTVGFSGRSSGDYLAGSCSVTLTEGVWRLRGYHSLNVGSGTGCALIDATGLYSTDGTDSGTAPTALASGTNVAFVEGHPTLAEQSTTSPLNANGAGANARYPAGFSEVLIGIDGGSQAVFAVARIDFSTAGTAGTIPYIRAERVF